jgi:hypothetical protein
LSFWVLNPCRKLFLLHPGRRHVIVEDIIGFNIFDRQLHAKEIYIYIGCYAHVDILSSRARGSLCPTNQNVVLFYVPRRLSPYKMVSKGRSQKDVSSKCRLGKVEN